MKTLVRLELPHGSNRQERKELCARKPLLHVLKIACCLKPLDPHSVIAYQQEYRDESIALQLQALQADCADYYKKVTHDMRRAIIVFGTTILMTLIASMHYLTSLPSFYFIETVFFVSYYISRCFWGVNEYEGRQLSYQERIRRGHWTATPLEAYISDPLQKSPIPEPVMKDIQEIRMRLPKARFEVEHFYDDPFIRVFHPASENGDAESYYIAAFDEKGFVAP